MNLIHKVGLSQLEFEAARFEKVDLLNAEDYIYGTLKSNCEFEMSEVKTWVIDKSHDGDIKYSEVFSGLFAKIETPKPFNTLLYIRKDRKDKNILNGKLSRKLPFDKLRMQLDSPEFEKVFDVYASDKIIAMQLLTADIMQDLVQFYNKMGIDYELTIRENYMYMRFWCGEMFEAAKLNKVSIDRNTLYKYYRMLDFIFSITNKMVKVLNETQYN